MAEAIEPVDLAEFLRDVYEATARRQQTITEQTKGGFHWWCTEARTLPGVVSPLLADPGEPATRLLEVPKPGPRPGPSPREPERPVPDADGHVDSDKQRRYEVARQRYEDALRRFKQELQIWERHQLLYDNLFAARTPADGMELVVGVGLLVGRTEQGELRRHLVTAPAEVILDRASGRLVVELVDASRPEINWAPGDVRQRLVENEAGLADLVDASSIAEMDAAVRKLATSFGRTGTVVSSPGEVVAAGALGFGTHCAVLLRKKDSSALLQLLQDMASDMSGGGFISDPFRMIVDPTFIPAERHVINERAVLPLPANTDQRSMIERARVEPHMVIQGPPGTGKTHTIANLAAVLMAEGRRVLITAENERALVEVQSKLPASMQPLLLPMLRERGTGPLSASVNELTSQAGSGKSTEERSADIDKRLRELSALEAQIGACEERLTLVSVADLEDRTFRGTTMRLAGHIQALAEFAPQLELVDLYLSDEGFVSGAEADAFVDLAGVVDERHVRMRQFPLPEGLMAPGDLGVLLSEHRGKLAVLGDPGDFDHATLQGQTDKLQDLERRLTMMPPVKWVEITRSGAEYEDASREASACAGDVDHGVSVDAPGERLVALSLLAAYLDLDEHRFDQPLHDLVGQHAQAVANAGLSDKYGTFNDVARSGELTYSAQYALDLLARDQSGLLKNYVQELECQGRSSVDQLVVEAAELVNGARSPLGLPVQVSDSAPPAHELLVQAEGLREHFASGGKFSRAIIAPRPVRDASGLLEHVRIDGSVIDTLEEAQRAVQFFAHRKAISLIDAWGYQHQINRPEGVDHHTWLTAIMELPAKAAQVREALELGRMLLTFSAGLQPDAPEDLLRAALASVAREIVLVLGPLADAASRSSVDVRVDGVPIRNRADASRAIAAFRAASTRSRCHHLLPPEWRWHCDPLDVEPDALVEMLGICAVAAAVPGRARSSDLTASSVRRLIERIEVDRTRVELLAEHTRVIGGLRRTLAGCVPKSPATTALDAALEAESSTDYRAAMDALEAEREMASRASRFAEAETALIAAHPDLVAAFRVGDERATAVLRYLEAYQSLRDYRSEVRRWKSEVGSSEEIHLELAELHKSFRRLEQSISGMMCWSRAIDRIRDRRELRSALSALTTAMDKVPKTRTAKSYPARMKALRDATKSAAPAIPCWVMPIDRIAEVLGYPTGEDRFDVVIVDESSQAWFTASFLYAIADQVIVVGDDLQTSPAAQILPDDNIRAVVDEHIPGHRLANQVGADLSLYDVASVMTGPDVMVDHFRCVPEIIEISNRLSYEPKGKRLLPSRVRPRGSLEPVRQVEVRGSRTAHGANVVEAEALVSQVAKCHADPAYSGMDFGVVVVGSNSAAHIKKLRELLLQMLGPTAITDRDIEVGTPAEFQGSERNVMFMSLVEAPPEGGRLRTWPHEHTGQNRRRVQQLNVAVSRAKDQLWVFRSFGPQALGPEDVRGVILQTSEAEFPSIEAELEKCESQFERDVVLALARAETGIRIRTQVEAIGYSIDIVVENAEGNRIAVECDGDRWHSTSTQIRKDLHRQRTLEGIGWEFERFLASEWYDDPEGRVEAILNRLRSGDQRPHTAKRGGGSQGEHSGDAVPLNDVVRSVATEEKADEVRPVDVQRVEEPPERGPRMAGPDHVRHGAVEHEVLDTVDPDPDLDDDDDIDDAPYPDEDHYLDDGDIDDGLDLDLNDDSGDEYVESGDEDEHDFDDDLDEDNVQLDLYDELGLGEDDDEFDDDDWLIITSSD